MNVCKLLRILGIAVCVLVGALRAANPAAAEIHCEVFFRSSAGEIKLGAGSRVLLLPASAESKEAIARALKADSLDALATSPRLVKAAVADSGGRAVIGGVPPGKYFVVSEVRWEKKGFVTTKKLGGIVFANAEAGAATGKVVVAN